MSRAREAAAAGDHEALIEMLDDPSWVTRRRIVAALAELGDDAVAAMVARLAADRSSETRVAATVDALSASRAGRDLVVGLAAHEDPAVVADAAQILGRRRDASTIDVLVGLVGHDDDNVAGAALEALGRVGGRAAVETLIEAVEAGAFFRRFGAIDVLGRTGDPRAVAALVPLLDDPVLGREAARALGHTGEARASAPLADRLATPLHRVAALALHDLAGIHQRRYGSTEPISETIRRRGSAQAALVVGGALDGASEPERQALAWVLGEMGRDEGVAPLERLLGSGAPEAAAAAAGALSRLGATPEIARLLAEGDLAARREILRTLQRPLEDPTPIFACLDDPDPSVRLDAARALARAGERRAIDALFAHLDDPDAGFVLGLVGAIQSLGHPDTERRALEAAVIGEGWQRRAALAILAYLGAPAALPRFLEAAEGDDARLWSVGLDGLTSLESEEAREGLLGVTDHPTPRHRAAAVRALGQAAAHPSIEERLRERVSDEDPWVRFYACQGLGRLGVTDAIDEVAARLDDPAPHVRLAAVEALAQLGASRAKDALLSRAGSEADPDLRRAAIIGIAVGRFGGDGLAAVLRAAGPDEPDEATRLVAISSLAPFAEDPSALAVLVEAASAAAPTIAAAAVDVLARCGTVDSTRALATLVVSSQGDAVRAALSTAGPGRVQGIVDALREADDRVAPPLATALVRLGSPGARAALLGVLREGSAPARRAAAAALGGAPHWDVGPELSAAAAGDPDVEVRRIASLGLEATPA